MRGAKLEGLLMGGKRAERGLVGVRGMEDGSIEISKRR